MSILKNSVLLSTLCVCLVFCAAALAETPRLGKDSVNQIVAAMTLEEKASLVVGMGRAQAPPNAESSMIGLTQLLVPGAAGTTFPLERLGVTPMVLADGPAGLRINPTRPNDSKTYYCTAFPVETLLASTWDTDLLYKVGQAMGNEVLEYGADVLLAPALNIHRDPLCGRNFEYYSEDPLISGKMAAAMVGGVQSQGVGTSIKHFAANNSETNRRMVNTIISERALREIYLEGFRIAVQQSQPWTVMSSYNLINGSYTSESFDLLTNILRNDWGFQGYVMTDWGAGKDPVAQMAAGNDLITPGSKAQTQAIIKAVQDGKLDVKTLDQNVKRMLNIVLLSPRFKGYKYSNQPDLKAHAQVARQAATGGMILLKNNNYTLPFQDVKKIAAFGNTSYETITGGTGSGDVNEAYSVSLVEGLQNAGYSVNDNLQAMYTGYLKAAKEGIPAGRGRGLAPSAPITELAVSASLVNSIVNTSDAAIITIGRNAGEGRDRSSGEGDFQLSAAEQELVKLVSSAFHAKGKKTVVILNVGGVVETSSWKALPDAILLAWQGGQEAGNSIADILSGKVNPSGKLATTFPAKYEDNPTSATFPSRELPAAEPAPAANQGGFGAQRPAEVTYEDGIYVGYRYFETFGVSPSYEFGYGLSYTTFSYGNLKLGSANFNDKLAVSVDIKNSGKVAGREIVQLYLAAPTLKLDKPSLELKGFSKTRLLQPGETQTISFTLDSRNLASFDSSLSAWVADPGAYTVKIGASSRDIRLQGAFSLAKELIVKKETPALAPKAPIKELKSAGGN